MSFSKQWTEWHLTARGWESGSERVDFAGTTFKDPPADRALTYRRLEEHTSPYAKMHKGHELLCEGPDEAGIQKLRAQFGERPTNL